MIFIFVKELLTAYNFILKDSTVLQLIWKGFNYHHSKMLFGHSLLKFLILKIVSFLFQLLHRFAFG